MFPELYGALRSGDLRALEALARSGIDLNQTDEIEDGPLEVAIREIEDLPTRHAVLNTLLELGVDPRRLNSDGGGPLFRAVIDQDTEALSILLAHGADPNLEHDFGESLYSWAAFDYRYEAWDLRLPEEPTDSDRATEDAWLEFLDRLAIKYGKRRPDYLRLLRAHGALSREERKAADSDG